MPDNIAKIILAATHGKLTKVRDTLLIEDTINMIKCQFQFRTSDWENTIKTAVFVKGYATQSISSDDVVVVLLDENNECNIPYEVLEDSGTFSVGVWGERGSSRIVSNWMYYRVTDGCFAEGSSSLTPTPSVYEQIMLELQNHNHNDKYYTKDEIDTRDIEIESLSNLEIEELLT